MVTMSGKRSSLDIVGLDPQRLVVKKYDLNSNLWDKLPEALEEEILDKLPFSSLVPFRSACKRWRDFIHSSKVFLQFSSRRGRLVYFSRGKLFVFNKGTWETVSLQFLPCGLKNMVMTTGGLVCFRTSKDWEFIVCNPLTNCYKTLHVPCNKVSTIAGQPCMPTPERKSSRNFPLETSLVVGMVVNRDTGHFKLVVGGFFPGSHGTTLVYDSHVDSWTKAANIPDDVLKVGRSRIRNHHPVVEKLSCGGNLYFHFEHRCRFERLLEYNVELQVWGWIKMPFCAPCNFLQQNGRIVAVMQVEYISTYSVYELQDAGSLRQSYNWRENWYRNGWRDNCTGTYVWPFPRVREAYNYDPPKTRTDFLGEGDVIYSITRGAALSLVPQKTFVTERFHEVETNNLVITNWEDYIGDEHEGFQTFIPSTVLLK